VRVAVGDWLEHEALRFKRTPFRSKNAAWKAAEIVCIEPTKVQAYILGSNCLAELTLADLERWWNPWVPPEPHGFIPKGIRQGAIFHAREAAHHHCRATVVSAKMGWVSYLDTSLDVKAGYSNVFRMLTVEKFDAAWVALNIPSVWARLKEPGV
jgi:hypothetical protein